MSRKTKRWLLQLQILLALLALASFVFYQQVGIAGSNVLTPIQQQLSKTVSNSTNYSIAERKTFQRILPVNDDLLEKVFITVKTTGRNHLTRLPVIIKTWFQLAKKQILNEVMNVLVLQ
ncbi:fringe glycosyltransferase [Aphis craccivora]|uniref:Fringe glycosyltransferase n=1 Tax=Aphis craccivora TaxID=307492 RepID=A0A6G0Z014_APHCR|nr:fringe glycosyltransferase [Aphis craccivora]